MNKEHMGSDFDAFLKQEGLLAECEAGALKPHENQSHHAERPLF
jgi:hypothetical protein